MKRLLFLFALLPMLAGAQVPIKNLVMEGAGIRGSALDECRNAKVHPAWES